MLHWVDLLFLEASQRGRRDHWIGSRGGCVERGVEIAPTLLTCAQLPPFRIGICCTYLPISPGVFPLISFNFPCYISPFRPAAHVLASEDDAPAARQPKPAGLKAKLAARSHTLSSLIQRRYTRIPGLGLGVMARHVLSLDPVPCGQASPVKHVALDQLVYTSWPILACNMRLFRAVELKL